MKDGPNYVSVNFCTAVRELKKKKTERRLPLAESQERKQTETWEIHILAGYKPANMIRDRGKHEY